MRFKVRDPVAIVDEFEGRAFGVVRLINAGLAEPYRVQVLEPTVDYSLNAVYSEYDLDAAAITFGGFVAIPDR